LELVKIKSISLDTLFVLANRQLLFGGNGYYTSSYSRQGIENKTYGFCSSS
jgi:DNA-binding cell septation regulator SpoVG